MKITLERVGLHFDLNIKKCQLSVHVESYALNKTFTFSLLFTISREGLFQFYTSGKRGNNTKKKRKKKKKKKII